MNTQTPFQWLTVPILAGLLLHPVGAIAQFDDDFDTFTDGGVTVSLRPTCLNDEEDSNDSVFGEIPAPYPLIDLGNGRCRTFSVEDPFTLRTDPMNIGETLDIEVYIRNNDELKLKRARTWLSYDPNVLEGQSVDIDGDFPTGTPGEADFDEEEGFVMIEASANDGREPDRKKPAVARIRFTIIDTPSAGTVISFYDVQQDGHTTVTDRNDNDLLSEDPGSLHVIFGSGGGGQTCRTDDDCILGTCTNGLCQEDLLPDGELCSFNSECESGNCENGFCAGNSDLGENGSSCTIDSQCQSDNCIDGTCVGNGDTEDGGLCTQDEECLSGNCVNGQCEEYLPEEEELENGESCLIDEECVSGFCDNGICADEDDGPETELLDNGEICFEDNECRSGNCENGLCADSVTDDGDDTRTAFGLLQVQNLRGTTEDSSVYLAWDPLQSSQLHAYNVYYGTTSGRYIQRKTVGSTVTNLTLHSLPVGTTYYFAVRAVSTDNEESAFSHEISLVVGDPNSSTSPLILGPGEIPDGPTDNPVDDGGYVPGETGIPTILIVAVLSSALIGTFFASRRQLQLTSHSPHE